MILAHKRKFVLWNAAAVLLSVVALATFIEDISKIGWLVWLLPPLMVMGFCGLLWAIRPDSFARGALWFSALIMLAFVAIYDLLDLVLDPIGIRSDWLTAGVAAVVLVGLWSSLSAVVAVEEG